MKILVVCQYYDPEPFRIPDICRSLVQRGHQVTVVTGTPNYPEGEIYPGYEKGQHRDEILDGVRVHRCPIVPRKRGAVCRFLNYYSYVFSANRYLAGLKEDFDVVFVNQLSPVMMAKPGLRWAKKNKKQCVLYCLDLWPGSLSVGGIRETSFIYRFFLRVSQKIYGAADVLMVSSRGFLDYFRQVLQMDPGGIVYLPQYAEDLFRNLPAPCDEKQGADFVFAGNVGTGQSVETLVQAAKLLQQDRGIRIHIVGGGIALDHCKELAQGLDNVTFYGRRPLEEMPGFYAMADAMVITLQKDDFLSYNFPGKVQSYLEAGKAVIAAVDGETERIINEADCGLCSPAEDPEALAESLRRASRDRGQLALWGRNAKDYYEKNFSKDRFMDCLEKTLQEHSR